jgi:NAD(P)-dependent dehydrogenase (short-subunit alcohol dehydrogenase family)
MKSVVVTGAERGVGKSIIEVLLEEDYHLIAVSISMSALEIMKQEMIKEHGASEERIDLIEFDLRNAEQIDNLMVLIKNKLAKSVHLHGFVNNAAIYFPTSGRGSGLLEIQLADLMEIVKVNMISAFFLAREMFGLMKRQKCGGSIVFISSVVSKKGSVTNPVYAMTKAGLANLAKTIAIQGGGDNIRANAISPGVMETEMGLALYPNKEKLRERMEKNLIKRPCTTEEVARLAAYLLSGYSGYMTGQNLDLSGGSLIR